MPPDIPYKDNPAAFIGVLLAEMAKTGEIKRPIYSLRIFKALVTGLSNS